MKISEIKVGMLLNMTGLSSILLDTTGLGIVHCIDEPKARVEAVAHDWFVVRDNEGCPWFIDCGEWDLWEDN